MAQLHDILAVVFVDFLAELTPELKVLLVVEAFVDAGIVGQDAPPHSHRRERRDNRPHASTSELLLPVNSRFASRAIVVAEPAGKV